MGDHDTTNCIFNFVSTIAGKIVELIPYGRCPFKVTRYLSDFNETWLKFTRLGSS